ncbi:MAG: dihydrodipicolinate synthase family protein, partial [Usitatibacter sp.]
MRLDSSAKGVFVIAPTPFHPDGRIDEASIDRMTDFFIKAGVDGMTVLGQLGEAPKMEHNESVGIVKRVIGRFAKPVVVGVSAPGFAAMRALTHDAMAAGAAGVMFAPPNTRRTHHSIVPYYR